MSEREHIHLIGIGGTGMTGLAGLLRQSGCRVTGSENSTSNGRPPSHSNT